LARDRARAEWARADAHRAVLAAEARLAGGADAAPARAGAPVARIVIPALGLDEIVVEGVGELELSAGPGHLPGSPLPGERGNAIISAHRDRHFHSLDRVAVGDTVITETAGERVVWRITERRVVERDVPALWSTSGPTLTLTTCWPVRYFGPAPDRLLLTALPIQRMPRA
ncbi:MAG TPA: class D sortase, partial [Gemmatimonadaceae bacterium]|nr:class D sortase [Gemmatimonadaceae bacterium]